MPERSTWGCHRPGRHDVHQAKRSALGDGGGGGLLPRCLWFLFEEHRVWPARSVKHGQAAYFVPGVAVSDMCMGWMGSSPAKGGLLLQN